MNTRNKEYRKIVKSLVNKSFPDLKKHRIFVFEIPKYLWATAVCSYFIFFSVICPTRRARKYSRIAIKSILAHELSHIELNRSKPLWKLLIQGGMYYFSKKMYSRIEGEAEKMVIEKGYGEDLLKAKMESEKFKTKQELKKTYKRGYFSPKKIKAYMKKHNLK